MPKRVNVNATRHIDKQGKYLHVFRKERGVVVDETGSRIPKTTFRDLEQVITDVLRDYNRAHQKQPKHDHEIHQIFTDAVLKFRRQMRDADPDDIYPENKWMWFDVLLKVALHLDNIGDTKPSHTEMFIDSLEEVVRDRVEDVTDLFDKATDTASDVVSAAGSAVNAVAGAGERMWKNIKIITVVGLGLVGVAIVAPPVIRAVRETRPAQLEE